jgi:hypothetical protein
MTDYVEDRIAPHLDGLYKVETRNIGDDAPGCWHTIAGFLAPEKAREIIAHRRNIRAHVNLSSAAQTATGFGPGI